MNAKKIMGAVLVALLAAALFVGAGAAAVANGDTVFVYEVVESSTTVPLTGTWTHANGVDTVSFTLVSGSGATGYYALVGNNIVEGEYTKGAGASELAITVKYPTAKISVTGTVNGITYPVGSYYDISNSQITINAAQIGTLAPTGIAVIGANGIPVPTTGGLSYTGALSALPYFDGEGTYKLVPYFTVPSNTGNSGLLATAPADYVFGTTSVLLGKEVVTITIVDGADPTITAVADSVIVSNTIDVTITGLPGQKYRVYAPGFTIENQAAVQVSGTATNTADITMPNQGKVTVVLTAGTTADDFTITVNPLNSGNAVDNDLGDEAEVDIEITGGTITAAADKDAYYIGDDVVITGTSTAGSKVWFYVAGTNVDFDKLYTKVGGNTFAAEVKNGEFKFEIDGDVFQNFDAGTYTVYVAAENNAQDVDGLDTYATVALVLKQPFISVTDAPSVAVKGSTFKVTGAAEAAEGVYAYIFGTNFFAAAKNGGRAIGDLTGDNLTVSLKDNTFTVKAKIPKGTYDMAAGQYFMVVQHPMYDKMFNIAPNTTEEGKIVLNSTGDATTTTPDEYNTLFDVNDRQRANAAEALCQALDTENIDDMYVKLSFVVAAAQSVINPIPSEIAQGEKLTVSGSTNVGEGEVVTVELLSTAFAAVPKATVGSASFISLTTKTDENGNWEVTFDTSGLNVDEYTLTAAVNALGSSATAKVKVVEAVPETPDTPDTPDVPDTPDTPDTPTEPETPGFGALAALAGLGAVAVLLLRRE